MTFMKENRETFPKAVVSCGCLVKQTLLRLARQVSPKTHHSEAERVFKVMFVIGSHLFSPKVCGRRTPTETRDHLRLFVHISNRMHRNEFQLLQFSICFG
jgi:hypothetical protein